MAVSVMLLYQREMPGELVNLDIKKLGQPISLKGMAQEQASPETEMKPWFAGMTGAATGLRISPDNTAARQRHRLGREYHGFPASRWQALGRGPMPRGLTRVRRSRA
ncbi:hypothetical protein ACLB6G_13205 [Zhengella sp. ZM62]|uniref:hypothetical protein n=1 Tax=Zhengella sedimenti TaxID=3390035 RepID=UPI003976D07F